MPTVQISTLITVIFVRRSLKISRFKRGTMTKDRLVKKDARTEVVYLIPKVENIYMQVSPKDSRNAYFNMVLFIFFSLLQKTIAMKMPAVRNRRDTV